MDSKTKHDLINSSNAISGYIQLLQLCIPDYCIEAKKNLKMLQRCYDSHVTFIRNYQSTWWESLKQLFKKYIYDNIEY